MVPGGAATTGNASTAFGTSKAFPTGEQPMRITDLYFSWWLHPGKIRTLSVGGLNRTYLVHVPEGHDPKTPMPVVLALHGATMNGPMMAWFSGLNQKADAAGFIAVYPNGTGSFSSFTWNGGDCCGSAVQNKIDDVAFINTLLDDLMGSYQVDTQRIYATGISNGAVMAYRLASELADRIAAIAPVAGSMGTEIGQSRRPVSVLHIHGTLDEFIPFLGGKGKKSITSTQFWPVDHSIGSWVKSNGCDENPKIDLLSKSGDEMTVTRKTYAADKDGTEVVLVVIDGGGHTWPGMRSPARTLGASAMNISANDLIWDFFEKHPIK
jgi:polyhydroxybutyrate depolymerase